MYALSRKGDEEPQYEAGKVEPESGKVRLESNKEADPDADDSPEHHPSVGSENGKDGIPSPSQKASASRGGAAAAMMAARSGKSFARMSNEMEPDAVKSIANKMEATDDDGKPNAKEQKTVAVSPPVRSSKVKDTPIIGAVAVPGINATRISSYNSDGDDTNYSYTNRSVEARSNVTGTGRSTTTNREEPIEATRVVDAEADIEAQVHSRMQNQAKDIADLVHRQLMTNAAVPVDVQPSVQDTASVTTKDISVEEGDVKKKKKICIIAVVLLAIVAAVGAGVGVSVSKKPAGEGTDVPTQSPTLPPTPVTTRAQVFQGVLEPISGEQLMDTNSPQFQALNWLANDDAANMTVGVDSEETIKARYVAAVLYYAFGGDNWLNKYRFLSERDICSWNQKFIQGEKGLSCGTDGTVESFLLPENNLVGSIPPEIGYYTNLIDLNLANNSIAGSLASVVDLTRLEDLNFTRNALTGTLPEFLFTHRTLTDIDLRHNRFFGSISDSLGKSSQLRVFWAQNNSLTGTVPASVGQSWILGSLTLSSNQLIGTIPDFVSSSRMWDLQLGNNKLTGTIPTTVGSLSALKTLHLGGNGNEGTGLSGPIPSELGRCQNLFFLQLENNTLVESIPTEIGSLSSLEYLLLRTNRLTGAIPTEIGRSMGLLFADFDANYLSGDLAPLIDSLSPSIESLDFGGNQLAGSIPDSIGALTKLEFLDVRSNNLNGSIPSQFGNLTLLEILDMGANSLEGTLPTSIANLPLLTSLRVYGNDLTGSLDEFCTIWDEPGVFKTFAANTCGQANDIECPCCNQCCNIDIFECRPVN